MIYEHGLAHKPNQSSKREARAGSSSVLVAFGHKDSPSLSIFVVGWVSDIATDSLSKEYLIFVDYLDRIHFSIFLMGVNWGVWMFLFEGEKQQPT